MFIVLGGAVVVGRGTVGVVYSQLILEEVRKRTVVVKDRDEQ